MFEIDPAFHATSHALGDLALSHVRLQGDARFPWIVLIPRVLGARELEDLELGERDVLMEEILRSGAAVRAIEARIASATRARTWIRFPVQTTKCKSGSNMKARMTSEMR